MYMLIKLVPNCAMDENLNSIREHEKCSFMLNLEPWLLTNKTHTFNFLVVFEYYGLLKLNVLVQSSS